MTILAPLPVQSFKDSNGNPLAGGLLYTYAAGTSTAQSTYIDSMGVTANTNPIILNSRGEAAVWLTAGLAYKFILQDSSSNLIWSVDQISSPVTGGNPVALASAATTDIGGQGSSAIEISGTTTITSFGTNYNGPRYLRFTGALILTNSVTLSLPGAANITTTVGDTAMAYPNAGLNGWNVIFYQRVAFSAAAGANNDITSLGALTAQTGFRNFLINGNFSFNQRAYASGTATTIANQYTLDRWRVITSGQSLTFATSGNGNIVTAPAGGIEQIIDGASIGITAGVINWVGTATCTVDSVAKTKGQTVTFVPGTNCSVKFFGGTVSQTQAEPGPVPTPFEFRPIGAELNLCQYYLPVKKCSIGSVIGFGSIFDANNTRMWVPFASYARIPPTGILISAASDFSIRSGSGADLTLTGISFSSANETGCYLTLTHAGGGGGNIAVFLSSLNSNAKILFTGAEL